MSRHSSAQASKPWRTCDRPTAEKLARTGIYPKRRRPSTATRADIALYAEVSD